jgi:hypothetical protein
MVVGKAASMVGMKDACLAALLDDEKVCKKVGWMDTSTVALTVILQAGGLVVCLVALMADAMVGGKEF